LRLEGPLNHGCEPYRIWDGEKSARFVYFDGRLAKFEEAARKLIDEMNDDEQLTQGGHFDYADFEVVEVKATYEIGEPTPVEQKYRALGAARATESTLGTATQK